MLVANARMYAVTPQVRDAWRALFDWVSRYSGIPLVYVDHAAPAPLEALWSRHDLAATFMCGFPFASATPKPLILAAPISSQPRYRRQPVYCTDFVVRADSKYRNVSDTFGGRIGWTVPHSQSGFNAVRHHLLKYRHGSERLFTQSIGPLVTPRKVIEAVVNRVIDIGPLDSYVRDLLERHKPATAAKLRTVESTAMTPIPPLIASPRRRPIRSSGCATPCLLHPMNRRRRQYSMISCCPALHWSMPRIMTASCRKPGKRKRPAIRCRASTARHPRISSIARRA